MGLLDRSGWPVGSFSRHSRVTNLIVPVNPWFEVLVRRTFGEVETEGTNGLTRH